MQVLAGPRQVGKTTLARQVLAECELATHYASADDPSLQDRTWIEVQWDIARQRARESNAGGEALLVLDEVQKVAGWSEAVKGLWDQDTASGARLKVMLLGSSPLLMQQGLTESLAGRFELLRMPHWSLAEMSAAFGWSPEQFIYFGGYPGAASLIADEERWRRYILDSLVETTLSRDVLLLSRVEKPALLRQLFRLGCDYSGQILSFQKMVGQLQDAGNTTTLAHYLELLSGAGILTGLQKFSAGRVRRRASSPKLIVLNTALMSATSATSFSSTRRNPDLWGRLVESAVGAHLVNGSGAGDIEIFYWRERGKEVDFVVLSRAGATAIEVTTSRRKGALPGMAAFDKAFRPRRKVLVGGQGIPVEEFLLTPVTSWAS